jgi:hypothetical protein
VSAHVLETQRRYYADRAREYDDWWFKRGRYVLDSETERQWWRDVDEVETALAALRPLGFSLDLCVTSGGNNLYGSGR